MKNEEFEQKLRQQPIRQVPQAWRAEILAAATRVSRPNHDALPVRGFLSTFSTQLSDLLWPHPKAWTCLAAVWVGVLSLHLTTREQPFALAVTTRAPAREIVLAIREQRWLLSELNEWRNIGEADRVKPSALRPRSECRPITTLA
jgi:hypothetical protein